MRKGRAGFAFVWFLGLGLPSLAFAGAGKDGFAFLSMTESPRVSSLGGAGGALADEASASLDNPAALGVLRFREVQAGYSSLPASLSYGSLSYAHPFSKGAAAAHVHVLRYGDIARYDASGQRGDSFKAQDSLLAVSWGRPLGREWAGGLSFKQVSESIAGRSASVIAADAGALYRPGVGRFSFSAGLRNLGNKARFIREQASLPREMYAGAAARLASDGWVLAGEFRRPSGGNTSFHAGQEVWLYNALALRAGWRSDRDLGNGLTLGFGFKLRAMRVDYSFTPLGNAFGQAHRIGFSFRFGGAAEKAYREGVALDQLGHHAEAILKFKEALDDDPGYKDAVRSLREAVQALEKERGGDR